MANRLTDAVRRFDRPGRDRQFEQNIRHQLDQSFLSLSKMIPSKDPSPSDQFAHREQEVILADALEKLPESYREVLVFRHLKGLKFVEVADQMGFLIAHNHQPRQKRICSCAQQWSSIGGAPVMLWDVTSRKPIAITADGAGRALALSPDGSTLATYGDDDDVRLDDTQAILKRSSKPLPHPMVTRIAFARSKSRDVLVAVNGRRGAGSDIGQPTIWDIATLQETFTRDFEFAQYCVARSPQNPHWVATGGGNAKTGEVTLWDLNRKTIITKFSGHTRSVVSVAFSPNGQLLASSSFRFDGSQDSEIIVWDLKSRRRLTSFHNIRALSLAFSADGQRLYAGCSGDRFDPCRRIECFDVNRGETV